MNINEKYKIPCKFAVFKTKFNWFIFEICKLCKKLVLLLKKSIYLNNCKLKKVIKSSKKKYKELLYTL